ncbi:Uncharacterized protein APZ42_015827 [Daphnia magna]|uniref:Uncharacterized protein n=1 Tax=Daphnia magna TaxID=35525 RepID=A0A162NC38_9CRUS|nr:Uncharacterized protein APZ42_015827 [Daphnia magna]
MNVYKKHKRVWSTLKEAGGGSNPCKGRTGKHLLLRAARPVIYIVRTYTLCVCGVFTIDPRARRYISIFHVYIYHLLILSRIYEMPV